MKNSHEYDMHARFAGAAHYLVAIRDTGSITQAANMFGLHQTALSHRLKGLEEAVGQTLFERTTRSLKLTPAGEIMCEAADASMSEWSGAFAQLKRRAQSNKVSLSLPSSLALKWIVPALPRAQLANIDLSLEVQDEIVSTFGHGPDVTIRFGRGPYPGYFVSHLCDCDLLPVARPGVLASSVDFDSDHAQEVHYLKDKRGETDGTDYSWTEYLSVLKKPDDLAQPTLEFDRADIMLQAGIGGMGIALGRTLLVENDIQGGFLEIVGPSARIQSKYWVVTTPDFAKTAIFPTLLNWLRKEVSRSRQLVAER